MIDQGLLVAAFTYAMVLIGVGVVALLALAAWAARSPLNDWAQRRSATRNLRPAGEAFNSSHTPHPAH